MDTGITLTTAGATIVIAPSGAARVKIGRHLAAPLISPDAHQVALVHRGIHPDLIEIISKTGKDKIGIDQIRDVIRQGQFSPVQGERKVCLIPYGEALTPEAENALLKVLEEPTPYIAFVILVRNPGDLLPTIRSRSRVVRLPPTLSTVAAQLLESGYSDVDARYLVDVLSASEITPVLTAPVEDVSARRVAARDHADRATADELCTLVTGGGITAREAGVVLLARIVDGDPAVIVTTTRTLAKHGRDEMIAFLELEERIAFTALRTAAGLPPAYPDSGTAAIARRLGIERLIAIGRAVEEARRAVEGYTPVEPVLLQLFLTIAGVIGNE